MAGPESPSQDPRKAWKERDSARRAVEHVTKHPIPGMEKWIDKMRGKDKPEEGAQPPSQFGSDYH